MAKILLIEDEAPLLEEVVDWLTFEGYDVSVAHDGQAGVDLAQAVMPDLIISDVMMPKMDGYQVLQALRTRLSAMPVPFIFLTARASQEDRLRGMGAGADTYITKPARCEDLLGAVRSLLEAHPSSEV